MAERRMFAKTIVDSDAFLDMPLSSQALYFHLSMRADDDGFVNNPKKIQRVIGAADDDLKLLAVKRFVIPFDTGVCVIKHWRIHNFIRSDRYKETVYQEEKNQLITKDNKAYTLRQDDETQTLPDVGMTVGIPVVSNLDTQVRLGKDRIELGKDSIDDLPEAETAPATTPPATPISPIVISITLNDKTEYPITEADVAGWKDLYPAVDIMQELRKMKGWADANPTKRKTKSGIKRFINAWLSKEQDRCRESAYGGQHTYQGGGRRNTPPSGVDRLLEMIDRGDFDE